MWNLIVEIFWSGLYFGAPIFGIAYLLFLSAFRRGLLHPALTPRESKEYMKNLKKGDKERLKERKKALKVRRKELRRNRRKGSGEDIGLALNEIDFELDQIKSGNDGENAHNLKGRTNYVTQKWLDFGGGFYGLVALYTFAIIEFNQIADFIKGFTSLADFIERIGIGMIIEQLLEALFNFIMAIAWPIYWMNYLSEPQEWILWLVVGFASYRYAYWAAQQTAFKTMHPEDLIKPDNF